MEKLEMRQQDRMVGADSKPLVDKLWNLHRWGLQRLKSNGKLQKRNKAMDERAIQILIGYKVTTFHRSFLQFPTRTHRSCTPALPLPLPFASCGHALAPGHPSKHAGKA